MTLQNRVKRVAFFEKQLPEFIYRADRERVLMGDFNAVCYKIDGVALLPQLKDLLYARRLVDAYQLLHPKVPVYSFQNNRGKSRIDHIYVGAGAGDALKRSEILPYTYLLRP